MALSKDSRPVPAKCDQCEQLFGQYDRYAKDDIQVVVRCSKLKLNVATGEKEPDGHECFACEAGDWAGMGVLACHTRCMSI